MADGWNELTLDQVEAEIQKAEEMLRRDINEIDADAGASTADTATPNAARSLIRGRVDARARSRCTRARPFLRSTWPT